MKKPSSQLFGQNPKKNDHFFDLKIRQIFNEILKANKGKIPILWDFIRENL